MFEDVASASNLKFKHDLGSTGKYLFIESTPSGCAFLDYDNDGWQDIFLVQSGPVARGSSGRPHSALFRNKKDGTFEEVTKGSGLDFDMGYAQGVAVGDYDNDGFDDLFVTAYGRNHLLHNQRGSGKWKNVSAQMGLSKAHGAGYATSAAFGDYDNDGRLDLYVCYYAKWTYETNRECSDGAGVLDYCSPLLYDPEPHQLLHNQGSRFVDVSGKAGITKTKGRGLAVAFLDYNQDGRQDIFVANDLTPNMLWRNEGKGRFKDVAIETGCAFSEEGKAMAGMGVAIADYNRSGLESLHVTNFSGRPNALFKNIGGLFEESSGAAGLIAPHVKFLSFGCEFLDYDADGWSDIVVNNGHVQAGQKQREVGVSYQQRKQLLRNDGKGAFREIADLGELGGLAAEHVGRGLATGDYNNDGRLDILAMNQNAASQLLRNQSRNGNHWISFQTIGTKSNRNGAHARFVLKAGGARQTSTVRAGSSYLSHSDRRVYFGLGQSARAEEVTVSWPSGQRDVLKNLKADTFYTVTEGRGVTAQRAATR